MIVKVLKVVGIIAVIITVVFFGFRAFTKRNSPEATALYNKNGLEITVKYCRPAKKDRRIFGKMIPFGKVWRTGANEATSVTFNKDISISGQLLKAGTYGLFSIPEATEWIIIFNSVPDQWGAFTYDEKKDVLRVKAPSSALPAVKESFEISFEDNADGGANMLLAWDQTKVTVPIK